MRKITVLISLAFLILGSAPSVAKPAHQRTMNPAAEAKKAAAKKASSEMSVLDSESTAARDTAVSTTDPMVIPAGSLAQQAKAAEESAKKANAKAGAVEAKATGQPVQGDVASQQASKFKDSKEGMATGQEINSQAAALQKIDLISNGSPRGRVNGGSIAINGQTADVTTSPPADALADILRAKALKVGDPVTFLQGMGVANPNDANLVAYDFNPPRKLKAFFGAKGVYWPTDLDTQRTLNAGGDPEIARMVFRRMPDGSLSPEAGGGGDAKQPPQ